MNSFSPSTPDTPQKPRLLKWIIVLILILTAGAILWSFWQTPAPLKTVVPRHGVVEEEEEKKEEGPPEVLLPVPKNFPMESFVKEKLGESPDPSAALNKIPGIVEGLIKNVEEEQMYDWQKVEKQLFEALNKKFPPATGPVEISQAEPEEEDEPDFGIPTEGSAGSDVDIASMLLDLYLNEQEPMLTSQGELLTWKMFYRVLAKKGNEKIPDDGLEAWFKKRYPYLPALKPDDPVIKSIALAIYPELEKDLPIMSDQDLYGSQPLEYKGSAGTQFSLSNDYSGLLTNVSAPEPLENPQDLKFPLEDDSFLAIQGVSMLYQKDGTPVLWNEFSKIVVQKKGKAFTSYDDFSKFIALEFFGIAVPDKTAPVLAVQAKFFLGGDIPKEYLVLPSSVGDNLKNYFVSANFQNYTPTTEGKPDTEPEITADPNQLLDKIPEFASLLSDTLKAQGDDVAYANFIKEFYSKPELLMSFRTFLFPNEQKPRESILTPEEEEEMLRTYQMKIPQVSVDKAFESAASVIREPDEESVKAMEPLDDEELVEEPPKFEPLPSDDELRLQCSTVMDKKGNLVIVDDDPKCQNLK